MTCSATITYDKSLVRRALNRYMLRRLGTSFFVALGAAAIILAFSFLADAWNWFMSVLGAVLVSALAFILFVYIGRRRAAEGFFDKGSDPTVTFQFTGDGVRTVSDIGTTDLKWQVFDEILKFQDIWLLVYARSGYMTLPVDQLTPECMHFIETQIAQSANNAETKLRR